MKCLPVCCKYTASYILSIVTVQFSIDVRSPSIHLFICLLPSILLSSPPPLLFPRQQATYWPLNPAIFLLWRHSKIKHRGEIGSLSVNNTHSMCKHMHIQTHLHRRYCNLLFPWTLLFCCLRFGLRVIVYRWLVESIPPYLMTKLFVLRSKD